MSFISRCCVWATCLFWALFLFSCSNDVTLCESSTSAVLGLGFYQMQDGFAVDTLVPAAIIMGMGNPDSLYNEVSTSSVILPLNQNSDTSSFYVKPDSTGIGDTLSVVYTRKLHLVSPACGFVTYFHIDTLFTTYHNIDSLSLESPNINTFNVENIRIFF
jgi:hypothetical protein